MMEPLAQRILDAAGPLSQVDVCRLVCKILDMKNLTPKRFMGIFLTHSDMDMASRRRFWFKETGWQTTRMLVGDMAALAKRDLAVRGGWEELILLEAQEIVNRQGMKVGHWPDGGFFNAQKASEAMLDDLESGKPEAMMKNEMNFLHTLILGKLTHSYESRRKKFEPNVDDELSDQEDECDLPEQFEQPEASGLKYKRPSDPHARWDHRAKKITEQVLAMIAFACNRRCNGLQLENGLTFLSCGVSELANSFLHYIGLSVTRRTVMSALGSLGSERKEVMKLQMQQEIKKMAPFVCVDNIDFEERVHHKRIEKTSKLFHGSWGYFHTLPKQLLDSLNPEDLSLKAYKDAMLECLKRDIEPQQFYPKASDLNHWKETIKAQLAKVYFKHVKPDSKCKSHFSVVSPAVEKIPVGKPDIQMMSLMDAPDNSAEGVGELLAKVFEQAGYGVHDTNTKLQVVEGDVGTCLNIQSLRSQRRPSLSATTSLENLLLIPGAAHTLWNVAQAVLLHHWGDPSDSKDMGVWRTIQALGGKADKSACKKDFTSMINMMEKAHEASLVECILHVTGSQSLDAAMALPDTCPDIERILEACWLKYFSQEALIQANEMDDNQHYNFILRLRDFASIVEANRAMKAGDVGRLMLMWGRWAVMAQGLKGMTHYAIQLPRVLLLLREYLPKGLSLAIRMSLLVSPSGRAGHFVAKDFYLEVQNYWLKYFYNHSGMGTSIDRLTKTYSINIQLLQRLMVKLKEASGLKEIHQLNKVCITRTTLKNFTRMSRSHQLGGINRSIPEGTGMARVTDTLYKGVEKLHLLYDTGKIKKFHWGMMQRVTQQGLAMGQNPGTDNSDSSSEQSDEENNDNDRNFSCEL